MLHDIKEICDLTGKNRSDIYLLLNEGKLSFMVDKDGKRKVETSELLRLFPDVEIAVLNNNKPEEERTETEDNSRQKQEIYELRGMINDLKSQIDNVLDDNRKLLRLLEHQTSVERKGQQPTPPATELAGHGVENYRRIRKEIPAGNTEPQVQTKPDEINIWQKLKEFFFA